MKIYEVHVSPFYIRARNATEAEDIMWERFGVEYTHIVKIEKSKEYTLEDNADND